LSPRWPLAKAGVLRLASRDAAATLLDLGRGGALLAPVEGLRADQPLDAELVLGDDPAIPAIVATDSDRLVHLAFPSGAMALTETLAGVIRDLEAHYEAGLWQAAALANEVESLFGVALSDGVVAPDDLFSAGPAQERALSLRLEALMARALPLSDELAYVAATDRNGFTICAPGKRMDHGEGMHDDRLPMSPAMDAVTLRAARFSQKALVQTYRRHPGREPLGVVADLSAPVFVRGRHWGCVRIGRALPNAARV
jgi:methyl-accepting chemotaxis protein